MSQDARRARRAGKVVLQLYRDRAPQVAEVVKSVNVSCKEGCAHCCMMPATATVPEMAVVVEHLAARGDWKKRRPALERELTRQLKAFAGVNVLDKNERIAFFRRQLPCTFLTADRRCEIYPVRPTVCRYHMAMSAPEHCAAAGTENDVQIVDLRRLEQEVAIEAAKAFCELTGGPIALAFVLAAKLLGVKLDIDPELTRPVTMVQIRVKGEGVRP